LLIGAGSVTGISTAAADGPEVVMPGAQTVSEVSVAGAGAAALPDLPQIMQGQPAQPAPTYQVITCTAGAPLPCATVSAVGTTAPAAGTTAWLVVVNPVASFNTAQMATVGILGPAVNVALHAPQAISSLR
jgi:hypothetical protein